MKFRKFISAPGLLTVLRERFRRVSDFREPSRIQFSLPDVLMSATAMFSLKFPSLLKFDVSARGDTALAHNLRNVFGVNRAPSDTQMRTIIDKLEPKQIHCCLKDVFAHLQQGKVLAGFQCIDDSLLVAGDGTGLFSSSNIKCEECCTKKSRSGSESNYHQALSLVVVHPKIRQVLPICLEAISKQDGATKNDCEMNAAKRAIATLRREHPHLKMRLVLDGLFAKASIVKLAREHKLGFIIVAKDGDHNFLHEYFDLAKEIGDACHETVTTEEKGKSYKHEFYFANDIPLNKANPDVLVNVLEYVQTKNGEETRWVWITDVRLNKTNVFDVMRAGRARWRIENETFNTLKNLDYEFEHNFGHGYKNLCTNLYYIMMIAFLIDQVQALACKVFAKLLQLAKRQAYLWGDFRAVFSFIKCDNFSDFYFQIGNKYDKKFIIES